MEQRKRRERQQEGRLLDTDETLRASARKLVRCSGKAYQPLGLGMGRMPDSINGIFALRTLISQAHRKKDSTHNSVSMRRPLR